MRILVINYEYPPIGGGGGFVTRDIVEEIAAKGHGVTVITSHYRGLAKQECVNGVNIIRVPVLFRNKVEVANMPSMLCYLPSSILKGLLKFKRKAFDVINTHFAVPSGPAGYILSKTFNIPNVLSIHGGDIFDPSKALSPHRTPIFSNIVYGMLKTADRVVAQSRDTKRNVYKYYKIDRSIERIPLGIKKPAFQNKSRSHFGLRDDELVFCTIGRLVKRKNIDDMCDVLSHLRNTCTFKLLIIGDGPEREHLEELALQLNLDRYVRFLGNISDEAKFQILGLSDFYLSTALHEGFGLVFLEAMECGLPIVCYDRGGQKDFLASGKTGFLVEFGKKDDFHRKIIELINNADLRSNISKYNRNLVTGYYISTCAERYISLFKETISERSRAWRQLN
jgi:glycosyltransferase involved in cell wall biosynthesis